MTREAEYERALDEYRALMLHRVMNPLAVIRGSAQTLRDHPELSSGSRDELLAAIVAMSERLEHITVDPTPLDEVEQCLDAIPHVTMRRGRQNWMLRTA
jgi:signal transduction histidine kinase